MGRKQKQEGIYRFVYNDVAYTPGSIRAVGYNKDGEVLSEKEIRTAGPAAKIGLEADRASIHADGQDLAFITVKIMDADGNICPNANKLVKFSIEGEGILKCVGNGDPTCIESYQASERSAFHGLCLLVVRSTQNPGKIIVRASSHGIEDTIIEINTEEIANL
jgi:beta-galactosidase